VLKTQLIGLELWKKKHLAYPYPKWKLHRYCCSSVATSGSLKA